MTKADENMIVRTYHEDRQGVERGSVFGVGNQNITLREWNALQDWQRWSVDAAPIFDIPDNAKRIAPKTEPTPPPPAEEPPTTTTTTEEG